MGARRRKVIPSTAPRSMIDLHTHSYYSDGLLAPAELVQEAGRRGLRSIGLTDHDTTAGLSEAVSEAARQSIEVVPGVELSTSDGQHEIHLLGYFIDSADMNLANALADFARQRRTRVERIVERLRQCGVTVNLDRVFDLAGPGTLGRPHVARALVESGQAGSLSEAFDRYLGFGKPGYVPRPKVDPVAAVELVRGAGGVAVLAHPLTAGQLQETLARLVPGGLAGIEVYYGEYDQFTRNHLRVIADRWNLIPTGGSDYHGPGFKPGRNLGGPHVPDDTVERLRAAAALPVGRRP